jgi:hypothetical protein
MARPSRAHFSDPTLISEHIPVVTMQTNSVISKILAAVHQYDGFSDGAWKQVPVHQVLSSYGEN